MSRVDPSSKLEYDREFRESHREHLREYQKQWRLKNRERDLEKYRRYRAKHHDRIAVKANEAARKRRLKSYGLEVDEADRLLKEQAGKCRCCEKSVDRLYPDHSHVTGAFRGFICLNCNTGIGKLGDSVEGVQKAIEYLIRAQQSTAETS